MDEGMLHDNYCVCLFIAFCALGAMLPLYIVKLFHKIPFFYGDGFPYMHCVLIWGNFCGPLSHRLWLGLSENIKKLLLLLAPRSILT